MRVPLPALGHALTIATSLKAVAPYRVTASAISIWVIEAIAFLTGAVASLIFAQQRTMLLTQASFRRIELARPLKCMDRMTDAPLKIHTVRIQTGDADLPEDRFSDHVNNARYFAFINNTFQSWYRAMGIRGGIPGKAAIMAHMEYDFRSEVRPPSWVECRIEVKRVGRSSMEHGIEIYDLGLNADSPPCLAGQGRAVHVWLDRKTRTAQPWPAELISRCFAPAPDNAG